MSHRLFLKLCATVTTFLLGMVVVFGYSQYHEMFYIAQVELSEIPQPFLPPLVEPKTIDDIHVEFSGFSERKGDLLGNFVITNHSPEQVAYFSFFEDFNCSIRFDDGQKIFQQQLCSCFTGVRGWLVSPEQPIKYQIYMPTESRQYIVGFDFFVGKHGRHKVAWSKKIDIPISR